MAETPSTPKQEIKLFYCYAHEDRTLRYELQVHLAGLRQQYKLINWYDREILPSEEWEKSIDHHLSTADVILLLISPHFMNSDYCTGREMHHALERHHAGSCYVIPILLRPTYWEKAPFSTIQMLPTDAKPITSWPNRDEAFHDVVRGISRVIEARPRSPKPETLYIPRPGLSKTKEQWMKEADTFYSIGRYEEALTAYEQAIRIDPNEAHAYHTKGIILYELDRYEEALAAYEQAIRLDPNEAKIYCLKGNILALLNRHEEALVASEQAIRLSLSEEVDAISYYIKGRALAGLSRHEEALVAYEQAIHFDPNSCNFYQFKALSLKALERMAEARQANERARQLGC